MLLLSRGWALHVWVLRDGGGVEAVMLLGGKVSTIPAVSFGLCAHRIDVVKLISPTVLPGHEQIRVG